ncbi:hypothetical protein [Cupriavidus necator]
MIDSKEAFWGSRTDQRRCGNARELLLGSDPVLAERLKIAFGDRYYRTPDHSDLWQQSLLADREMGYVWDRDGAPVVDVIKEAALVTRQAAVDMRLPMLHPQERVDDSDSLPL